MEIISNGFEREAVHLNKPDIIGVRISQLRSFHGFVQPSVPAAVHSKPDILNSEPLRSFQALRQCPMQRVEISAKYVVLSKPVVKYSF